jgi:hypothetical protein
MVQRQRANRPRIVDETIDGEALIMDMVSGAYYGCDGASAFAWLALAGGATTDEVATALSERFGMSGDQLRTSVDDFVGTLVGHQLLVDRGDEAPEPFDDAVAAYDGGYEPAEALAVDAFTDLADLILLDPVHDVTEAGWPHKRE